MNIYYKLLTTLLIIFSHFYIFLSNPLSCVAAIGIDCDSIIKESNNVSQPNDRYKIGYCLIKKNYNKKGLVFLKDLETELPLITEYILYYRAMAFQALDNFESASKLYKNIISSHPDSPLKDIVHLNLATIYIRNKEHDKAEEIYKQIYAQEKDQKQKAFYLYRAASVQKSQDKYKEAQDNFIKVWRDYPQTQYAEASYKEALKIQSTKGIKFQISKTAHLKRAQILFISSRWRSALRAYKKSPKTNTTLINSAICYTHLGLHADALNILKKIDSSRSLFWQAKVKSKQNRDQTASMLYIKLARSYPKSHLAPESLYNSARLYQINKRKKESIAIYEELIAKYPKSGFAEEASWNLGWIYYKNGNYERADKTFSAFVNAASTFNASRSVYWTARIQENLGQIDKATNIYKKLAGKYFPSYYPFLAQLKAKYTPEDILYSYDYTINKPNNINLEKAELLIELGILEDAKLEIDVIKRNAKEIDDYIMLSFLYSQVNDFYNSINIVQGVKHTLALKLSYPKGYSEIVEKYTNKYGVDENLIYSIMREESRYQPDVVSPANARGLMQLIPKTGSASAAEIGLKKYNTKKLYDPETNIHIGTYYFKKVLDKFNGNVFHALGSYNAGPHRVTMWMGKYPNLDMDEFVEEIPFRETRNYIRRVLRSYGAYKYIYNNKQVLNE